VAPNKAPHTTQKPADMGWEVLTHLLNSADLVPSDFHLSGSLKGSLGGIKLENNNAVWQAFVHIF